MLKGTYLYYVTNTKISSFFPAVSKEEAEEQNHHHGKLPYNGYSDEFLDRLEPNGNIPAGKGDIRYGKPCYSVWSFFVTASANDSYNVMTLFVYIRRILYCIIDI